MGKGFFGGPPLKESREEGGNPFLWARVFFFFFYAFLKQNMFPGVHLTLGGIFLGTSNLFPYMRKQFSVKYLFRVTGEKW